MLDLENVCSATLSGMSSNICKLRIAWKDRRAIDKRKDLVVGVFLVLLQWYILQVGAVEGQFAKKMAFARSRRLCVTGWMRWKPNEPSSTGGEYPYTSANGVEGTCKDKGTVRISDYETIPYKDENSLDLLSYKLLTSHIVLFNYLHLVFQSNSRQLCKNNIDQVIVNI